MSESQDLDAGLGCLLGLRLDGLDHLRPWLKERGAAGHLLLPRKDGGGSGGLGRGERRGKGKRLGG